MRLVGLVLTTLMLATTPAYADQVQTNVKALRAGADVKIRLSAALALSKTTDERAVQALAKALREDKDAAVRRVAALALSKMLDPAMAREVIEGALVALETAAANDRDRKVRETAKNSATSLAGLRNVRPRPALLIHLARGEDQSKQASAAITPAVAVVRTTLQRKGLETDWPDGVPKQRDLVAANATAFIVSTQVSQVALARKGSRSVISCTVKLRVSPWTGSDGGERWEANRTAEAKGSAKAESGASDRDIQGGIRDCIEAVAEELTIRQIVPFVKKQAKPNS